YLNDLNKKKQTVLDGELKKLKELQQKTESTLNRGAGQPKEKLQELEKLTPVINPVTELPPTLKIKAPKISDFEDVFEKENSQKTGQPEPGDPKKTKKESDSLTPYLDEKLHLHVVYLTPVDGPKFSPVLKGKTTKDASRAIFKETPESWLTGDTPYNSDKGRDHTKCVRITSGYYAGYFNNEEYGVHLKGHPEAKSLWGRNWGGAWGTAEPLKAERLQRRLLFVIDVSNSMNGFDPPTGDHTCARRVALKQVIVKNSENVDYGLLFFHEKTRHLVPFTPYKTGSKKIYSSLDSHACRGEGGTNMTEGYNEAIKLFKNPLPFDTIIMITDQDGQSTPVDDIRKQSGGIMVITNRENLFTVLDHLVRL
ncbi:MAG: VWA domain-containing protein, partial [Oligoflexia bacterium]|nr:VWA domain-containing protein [Oligoflexia bacterium]